MLLCKGHASTELKEESGFNPAEWGDCLSAHILKCRILLLTMATNVQITENRSAITVVRSKNPDKRQKPQSRKKGGARDDGFMD